MYSERVSRLTSSLIREILAVAQRPEVISFAGGLPSPSVMPDFDFSQIPSALRQYGTSDGEPALRRAVATRLVELGLACTPDQVIIVSGSQQNVDLVAKLFIDPGTPVLVEAPTYLAALQSFSLFGARFQELELTPCGVDPQALERAASRERPAFAYLIPTFQNPSGYCYDETTRRTVAERLDALGIPLFEDDPYRDLAYEEVDRTPICAHLRKAPWIYSGSFSKTATPGLRVGYLAASKDLHPYLMRLKQATDLHTNRVGQWFLERFINSPEYPAHIERLQRFYRERRDAMQTALERHFGDLADWNPPPGGLFFWLRLRRRCDTRALLKDALLQNVAFMPGEPFYANAVAQSGTMRLNFSHAAPEQIDQGIGILSEIV